MTDAKSHQKQFELFELKVLIESAAILERLNRALGAETREEHGDDRPVDGCRCTWCCDLRAIRRDEDRLARATELAVSQMESNHEPEEWWEGLL